MNASKGTFIGLVTVGVVLNVAATKPDAAEPEARIMTIRAEVYTLPEPDPFLGPFLGDDTAGIESIVKDISKCREEWRKEAEKRIDEHRKQDLHIRILDPDGKPYAKQKVRVRQLKHKFHFGVAIKKTFFSEPEYLHPWQQKQLENIEFGFTLDQRYKLLGQFATQVGFANAFKYRLSAGEDHSHMINDVLPRLRSKGLSIRGHTLIWPGWGHMHKEAVALKDDPDALREFCEMQIREYAGLWDVDEWDVLNEPRRNHDIQDVLGEEIMAEWFRIAHDHVRNPGAGLYVNDYKVISMDDKNWNQDNIQAYRENVDLLLEHGAPLTHLGFQNRFHTRVKPEEIYRRLEQFRDYKLPMKSTEFEIRDSRDTTFSEEERARMTADIMTVWFSHDMVNGIIAWTLFDIEGSVDEKTGKKKTYSLMYNSGIKLNGKVWLYLMHNHWHTDELVKTDGNGITSVRGFLGDYEVLVRDGADLKRAELTLDKEQNIYSIQL